MYTGVSLLIALEPDRIVEAAILLLSTVILVSSIGSYYMNRPDLLRARGSTLL